MPRCNGSSDGRPNGGLRETDQRLGGTSSLKKMERGHCPGDEVKATEGVINPENTVKCISELYVRRKHLNDETLLCVILEAQGNRML